MISSIHPHSWLLFLDISAGEVLIIILAIFIIFGPNKIPEIARKLGRGFNEVRNASDQIRKEINTEINSYKEDLNVDIDKKDTEDSSKKSKK